MQAVTRTREFVRKNLLYFTKNCSCFPFLPKDKTSGKASWQKQGNSIKPLKCQTAFHFRYRTNTLKLSGTRTLFLWCNCRVPRTMVSQSTMQLLDTNTKWTKNIVNQKYPWCQKDGHLISLFYVSFQFLFLFVLFLSVQRGNFIQKPFQG